MNTTNKTPTAHPFEITLAVIVSAACIIITTQLWLSVSASQHIWLFPALYFIEMTILAILGPIAVIRRSDNVITWAITGIFLAFGILGAMTVGFYYLVFALGFGVISISADIRARRALWHHLAVCLLAAVAQVIFMIIAAILF